MTVRRAGRRVRSSDLGFNDVMRPLWLTGLGVVVLVAVLVFSLRRASHRSDQAVGGSDPSQSEQPVRDGDTPRGEAG